MNKNKKTSDTPKCKICGGRTATVTGVFYYEQDSEPYMANIEEEAECGNGECHVCAFVCDDCGHVQGLYSTDKQEELTEYSIDIDKQIMIGVKCESEPILIGAVDGGGFVIDLDKIIVKEIG